MINKRDEFSDKTKDSLAKRAAFICSNPNCHKLTLSPCNTISDKFSYIGKVAHITAASEGGPRYDDKLTEEQRCAIENGIFLCSNCADMIDKNIGLDFSVELLKNWKNQHDTWVKEQILQQIHPTITTIDGEHKAKGKGVITGIETTEPTFFKPGTKAYAEGEGEITGTKIGPFNNK
ncbi:MAG: hypothetical protein WC901_07905 [Candidatus Margulisiibacteriota bacterium]